MKKNFGKVSKTLQILVGLILNWNSVKSLVVTKIVQIIKFKGDWGELETNNWFQRQSWKKYIRQTLVFLWNNTTQENFNFYFSEMFY